MVVSRRRARQRSDRLRGWYWARVTGLTDDADETVLRDGARSPALADFSRDPLPHPAVIDVIAVEQRQ